MDPVASPPPPAPLAPPPAPHPPPKWPFLLGGAAEKASPDMVEKMERVCGCLCERLDAQMSPELKQRTRKFDEKAVQQDPEMQSVMAEAVRQCMDTGANGAAEQ